MKLTQYLRPDGSFDYEAYKTAQVAANHAKIHAHWCDRQAIGFLSRYIRARIPSPSFGLCHGTRRGLEQTWFREDISGCEVIGTEISDTASQFPYTVQWDFHDANPEWLGIADFVYSNSWDHAYDPKLAFSTWAAQLKPKGIMFIEHAKCHLPDQTSSWDPFGIEFDELVDFLNRIGKENFSVTEVITNFDFKVPDYFGDLRYAVVVRSGDNKAAEP